MGGALFLDTSSPGSISCILPWYSGCVYLPPFSLFNLQIKPFFFFLSPLIFYPNIEPRHRRMCTISNYYFGCTSPCTSPLCLNIIIQWSKTQYLNSPLKNQNIPSFPWSLVDLDLIHVTFWLRLSHPLCDFGGALSCQWKVISVT